MIESTCHPFKNQNLKPGALSSWGQALTAPPRGELIVVHRHQLQELRRRDPGPGGFYTIHESSEGVLTQEPHEEGLNVIVSVTQRGVT